MSYRDEVRRVFESKSARQIQNKYFCQLRVRCEALQRFEHVDDLFDLLRDPRANADQKDAALLALLEEHRRGSDGAAFALLAVAMFPALDRIYRSRVRGHELDDTWGRVIGGFVEAIGRYPVDRRRARVAANIEGEVMKSLSRVSLGDRRAGVARDRLACALAFAPSVEACEPLGLGDLVQPGAEPAAPPDPLELEAARAAAEPFFDASAISAEDRFLILGVHLYERTLGELAAELGISREAAKKRHLRALTRLRATCQRENIQP